MLTPIDFYRGIKSKLETYFPNILVQTKDIKTPLAPCFYIQFVSLNSNQIAVGYKTDLINFNVIYFAKNESLLELLEMQNKLEILFEEPLELIKQDDKKVYYQEIQSQNCNLNEDDYILTLSLDFEVEQGISRPQDDFEIMETLDIRR